VPVPNLTLLANLLYLQPDPITVSIVALPDLIVLGLKKHLKLPLKYSK
jgi:hypothetical protein